MTTVRVTADSIELTLTTAEKIGALRGDLRVPRSAVVAVEVVPDGLAATRGLRAPGLAVPGVRKVGTWRGAVGKQFVSVRRGEPAVRVRLAGQPYDVLLIGSADAPALAAELGAGR
jgi:hypothetical protein